MKKESQDSKKGRNFNFRMDEGLERAIDDVAGDNNQSKADAVRDLIKNGFDFRNNPNPLLPQEVQVLIVKCGSRFVLEGLGIEPEKAEIAIAKAIALRKVKGALSIGVFVLLLAALICMVFVSALFGSNSQFI